MRRAPLIALIALPLQTACAQEAPAPDTASTQSAPAESAPVSVSDAEIFTAAGFAQTERGWEKCGDDSGSPSYTPGAIEQRGDFNNDGRPDAVVTEGGAFCFGDAGSGYTLVSQQADGSWRIMGAQQGVLTFLGTKGSDGWPDIALGGPGFCFPVLRWDGREYSQNRMEYDGKPCAA